MLSNIDHLPSYQRSAGDILARRIEEPRRFIQVLAGPRQAGKTTLAHYLELLEGAGMVLGLSKYCGAAVRRRASSPKLQVMNTALMAALSGLTKIEAQADRSRWGRLVESSVGAHLVNAQTRGECRVFYWRAGDHEVDFVVESAGKKLTAIEVKSGPTPRLYKGMEAFEQQFQLDLKLMVGEGGIPTDDFLSNPISDWMI